jgi:hypothetical protein
MSGIVCAGNGIVGGEQGVLNELSLRTFLGRPAVGVADVGVHPAGPVMSRAQVQAVTIA